MWTGLTVWTSPVAGAVPWVSNPSACGAGAPAALGQGGSTPGGASVLHCLPDDLNEFSSEMVFWGL